MPVTALYTLPVSRNGLLGRYYRGNNWSGVPATVRLDPFIDANDLLPAPFSIEWDGKVNFPQSGSYAIGTLSDDGSQVFIDERLVVDNGGHHADRYVEARATFTEGLHNIRIRYNQDDGGRKLELWWTTPAGKRELIPVSVLFPPGITPTGQELASQLELPRAVGPPQAPPPVPASPPVNVGEFSPKGSQVWGAMGQGDGQFNEPRGIAVGRDGSVYVADAKNTRIERFDANGTFLGKYGQGGNGEGDLAEPFDIATDSAGNVYVMDSMSATIKKFSPDLKFQGLVPGNHGFYRPRGLGIDAQGNLYVADTGHNRVVKLSSAGQALGTIGSQGPGKGQFDQPTDVAVDRDGNIYVADTLNRRVQKLDTRGAYVTEWPLSQANTFNSPHIVVGEKVVFVTEPERGRVVVFSTDGAQIAEFGAVGTGENEMLVPLGIALDQQGNVYVTEVGNHRVHKFELAR